jgi:hypothetical protein
MKFRVPENTGNFSIAWETIGSEERFCSMDLVHCEAVAVSIVALSNTSCSLVIEIPAFLL